MRPDHLGKPDGRLIRKELQVLEPDAILLHSPSYLSAIGNWLRLCDNNAILQYGENRFLSMEGWWGEVMSEQFFEQPILNSPYDYPNRYWELDETGQPTHRIIEGGRSAQFITPIPKPKK